jgi:DNA-directed RNA polymerase subunit RPC12/RpoP
MDITGSLENQPEKTWYRCSRCRHAVLVDLTEIKKIEEEAKKKVERSDCSEYKPQNTYTIGQAIFHSEWDDIGKIVSKERTSGGASAIVVSFEKLGERRLLESIVDEDG